MATPERISDRSLVMRGQRVMIDADLAALYGVSTKRLNEQVKRNRARFPRDFAFRLTTAETAEVVANCDHLSRLRCKRLDELERKADTHDRAIGPILDAIRQVTQPPETPKRRRIGFL